MKKSVMVFLLALFVMGSLPSAMTYADASSKDATVDSNGYGFSKEPQPLYSLPADHRLHRGDFYQKTEYHEWHYFTMLGKDLDTGEDVTLFICHFQIGWDRKQDEPKHNVNFAWHNQNTGEFKASFTTIQGKIKATGTDPNADDFKFSYDHEDENSHFHMGYDYASETWTWKGRCDISDDRNTPYAFDGKLTLDKPGYIPAAYNGLENIGYHPDYLHNPETMAGLTYYIQAPNMTFKGAITLDGKKHRVEGKSWFEHQWGNYRAGNEQNKYFWGYMRLDNGDAFSWRQYYKVPGFKSYDPGLTRFLLVKPDGGLQYAFGPSFKYTPTKMWTSPTTGVDYPWWGEMDTPVGNFYFGPRWPAQESISNIPGMGFIEGVAYIHEGSPDGPIVGTDFIELVDLIPGDPGGPDEMPKQNLFLKKGEINR